MTDETRPATDRKQTDRTMRNVSHTHPYTDRGAINRPFERGPVVAADGGEREAYDEESEEEENRGENDQMKDIDHTPPHGEGANRVFERGREEGPVESEE